MLDQELVVELRGGGEGAVQFSFPLDDLNTDGRALARRFDHERQLQPRMFSNVNDLPIRRAHAVSAEFFLGGNFVESDLALGNAFARVSDSAVFQNLLQLSVLAEGAVDDVEGNLDVVRQCEVGIADIDLCDIRS